MRAARSRDTGERRAYRCRTLAETSEAGAPRTAAAVPSVDPLARGPRGRHVQPPVWPSALPRAPDAHGFGSGTGG